MSHSHHSPVFVVLSLIVAVLGSWTALDLFRRVTGNFGRARAGWLAAAAFAMGLSIWSMHFVAMLGFDPGSAVSYDPWLTVASLLLAIGATAVAFFVAASERAGAPQVAAAGVLMGAGICTMHYVGMAAVVTAVSLGYDAPLVALSFGIAVVASTAALFVARGERSTQLRGVAALVLGLAVVGMHYTAMAALRLTPAEGADVHPVGPAPLPLAFGVAGTTVLILFLALMASLYDQRGNILAALEAGGVGYWELDLRSWRLHISPKGKAIFGLPPEEGLTYAEALSRIAPDSRAARETRLMEAIRTGTDYDVEYPLAGGGRWVNARGRTVRAGGGRAARMVGVVIDVTERRQAVERIITSEKRQRLLVDELNHRVKNTLATVQSISRQTARGTQSAAAFHRSFEARLQALSATHNALTRHGWEQASLSEIVVGELKAYPATQVTLTGEDVALSARHALALGMVIHELAANAARHGALAGPDGHVRIGWRVELRPAGEALVFEWSEQGVAALQAAPLRAGFGSRLIRRSVEDELEGKVQLDFEPNGFCCRFCVPLDVEQHLGRAAG
ncbi:MHYT domain-containing protein [Antarcticirhabdus aurantiaca]|uniref:PAS domain-containing protein n=1 Tax=Antarcticirhabdus aurantiaca TaxID=2606717 RepID=A0ACD4NRD3_9HYPH|nr:MHYT domain-containing protein [Antarcticirhabdus aurantiaca]WAJ29210.1 PAS domain-containing protein [Jeongeuplla avenae]